MKMLTRITNALLHIVYPHLCAGCETDILPNESQLCVSCLHHLPITHFEKHINNPVEKMLSGRIRFQNATAQMYFSKHTALQKIMHQFKYKGNQELGKQLGLLMGHQLLQSGRFVHLDALVPLPLHSSKERERGYNQAEVLCNGIAEVLKVSVVTDAIQRRLNTESQTRKNREQRWQNMEDKFSLTNETKLANKQVLLVDDVITTGATLEACAKTLSNISGITINVAALCVATHS